ncbi:MAG: hypothetical protein ACYC9X_07445 [Dehalococcoidia bacterium]
MAKKLETVGIPVAWIGLDDAQIIYVNQLILQMGAPDHLDEFILTFGQLHPPALMGDLEQNRAQLQSMPYVPVKVVAKLALSEGRVRELLAVIEEILGKYDEVKKLTAQRPASAKREDRRRR